MLKWTLSLASTNPGKLREFQQAAIRSGIAVQPVLSMGELPPCVEDGLTFEANARKKALHYALHTPGLVFADDSGISVDALGGAPGVHSARFAGPGATDEANNRKLVSELHRVRVGAAVEGSPRIPIGSPPFGGFPAHYTCVIALAEGEKVLSVVKGCCHGLIVDAPRGRAGFGYDPYFFYPQLGKTFAEITAEEKFQISHRGLAFRKLLEVLSKNPARIVFRF